MVILFDAVGTLLRPDPPFAEVYARVGREYGSDLSEEEIGRRFRSAFRETCLAEPGASPLARPATSEDQEWNRWRTIVSSVFRELPTAGDGLFFALWEHFARSDHWAIYDDVADILPHVLALGHPVGIASNFDRRLVPICRAFRCLRPLQPIFTSAGIGYSKPCPRFFAAIEKELQTPAPSILLIGDDFENDYQGARAAGWQVLLVDRDGRHPEVTEGIASLTELKSRLSPPSEAR